MSGLTPVEVLNQSERTADNGPVAARSPAGQIGAAGLHVQAPHLLGQESVLRRVLVDVQLYLLVLRVARLPVSFDAVAVVLLAAAVERVLLLAGPQAVVLAIIASAGRQDVLLDVTRRRWLHISRYNLLAAEDLTRQLADGRLVHGQRRFTPDLATGLEVEPLRYDAGTAFVAHVFTVLPDGLAVARIRFLAAFHVVALGRLLDARQGARLLRFTVVRAFGVLAVMMMVVMVVVMAAVLAARSGGATLGRRPRFTAALVGGLALAGGSGPLRRGYGMSGR